jgi:hypothetical protein
MSWLCQVDEEVEYFRGFTARIEQAKAEGENRIARGRMRLGQAPVLPSLPAIIPIWVSLAEPRVVLPDAFVAVSLQPAQVPSTMATPTSNTSRGTSMPHLAVTTLGNRNSGKSSTWNTLFGGKVKTGKSERPLYLNKAQYVNLFLVSGSPEERDKYVGEIITVERPSLVLCSTQYVASVRETYDYFFNNGYEVHVQWLNPGYSDFGLYEDSLELLPYLLRKGATVQMRDGRLDPRTRVQDLTRAILGWATYHDLVHTKFDV